MTHDELREKVARALFAATWEEQLLGALRWEDCKDEHAQWLERADAALAAVREALREPTLEMVVSANGYVPRDPGNSGAAHHWRAMLAASPLADPRA